MNQEFLQGRISIPEGQHRCLRHHIPNREIDKDKNRSGHAAATEVPHRAETTSAPTILHDSLLHPSRPLCRQDARLGLSSLEEPRQGS